jgi:hypothetical protein
MPTVIDHLINKWTELKVLFNKNYKKRFYNWVYEIAKKKYKINEIDGANTQYLEANTLKQLVTFI